MAIQHSVDGAFGRDPDMAGKPSKQELADFTRPPMENDPVWNVDPNMLSFKDIPRTGRLAGYAGPPGRAAAEALTKSIIVDMYAKAIQGVVPETSVRLADEELTRIYAWQDRTSK